MTLQEEVRSGIPLAMKEKNQPKLDTLRSILSGVTHELITLGRGPSGALTDEEVLAIIRRLVKQRKDSIEQFEKAGRQDLVDVEKEQLAHLECFLPALLGEEEVRKVAVKLKERLGVSDKTKLGILIGAAMKELAGKADGALVKRVVEGLFE